MRAINRFPIVFLGTTHGARVYPYGLTYFRGSLYLIAHAPDHNEIRHYKVDRIEDAEQTALPFNRPGDFDLEKHLAGSFGVFQGRGNVTVKVRFAPTVARYVEESHWHASQQLAKQRDGHLIATFALSNTEEIARWILSFGKHALVLEPLELCERIADEAEAILRASRPEAYNGRLLRGSMPYWRGPRRTYVRDAHRRTDRPTLDHQFSDQEALAPPFKNGMGA